jgi:hypothetical protein
VTRVRGNPALAALLTAAAAPPCTQDGRDLAPVLAAFRTAGHDAARIPVGGCVAHRARPRRAVTGRSAVKCVVALALAIVGAMVAAQAGALPAPIQRFAHQVLGVPAPGVPGAGVPGSATTTTSASAGMASPTGDASSPSAAVSASAVLAGLCQTVVRSGGDWRQRVGSDGQATLIAAAGGEQKVPSYCARLLSGTTPSSRPSPLGAGSAPASSGDSATHHSIPATPAPAPTHTPPPVPHPTGH